VVGSLLWSDFLGTWYVLIRDTSWVRGMSSLAICWLDSARIAQASVRTV